MIPTRISGELGSSEIVVILFYRLKPLTEEEKYQWYKEWAEIQSHLPHGIKMMTEAKNAFTSYYTGFAVYEGTMSKFEEMVTILEERTRHVIDETYVVIGTKGSPVPTVQLGTILQQRPVD